MFELETLELRMAGRTLLEAESLCLPAATRLVLTGPSGCGKSTLLRVLGGLDRPAAGRVLWQGRPLASGGLVAHRRRVHLVLQQPLLTGESLEDALLLGLRLRGLPTPTAAQLQEELAALGLEQLDLKHSPAGLSGGECMRAALLRALLLPVECLLLDEPTTGLDDAAAALVVARLTRTGVPPLISASHDPRWWAACPARLEFRSGRLHGA